MGRGCCCYGGSVLYIEEEVGDHTRLVARYYGRELTGSMIYSIAAPT